MAYSVNHALDEQNRISFQFRTQNYPTDCDCVVNLHPILYDQIHGLCKLVHDTVYCRLCMLLTLTFHPLTF